MSASGLYLSQYAIRHAAETLLQCIRIKLVADADKADEFGAIGEEFRCAALIIRDMALTMGEHCAPRRGDTGNGEGIGGGAGCNQRYCDIMVKQLAEPVLDAACPWIIAIGGAGAGIGAGQRCHHGRMGASGVIRGKIAAYGCRCCCHGPR
jgi:hypothetical protein